MAGKIKMDFPEIPRNIRPIQLGFVPECDCAPLVFAHESGLFERYELAVELRRETCCADGFCREE